jgi:hypothetical protein
LILQACVYCCSCSNTVTTFLIPKNAKKVHAEREKPKAKSLDLGGSTLNKCEQSLIPYPFFAARILVASESAKEKFFPIPTEVGQVYSSVLFLHKIPHQFEPAGHSGISTHRGFHIFTATYQQEGMTTQALVRLFFVCYFLPVCVS